MKTKKCIVMFLIMSGKSNKYTIMYLKTLQFRSRQVSSDFSLECLQMEKNPKFYFFHFLEKYAFSQFSELNQYIIFTFLL